MINPYRYYHPNALAYFAQLTTNPSDGFKNAINTLVKQLIADGNWSLLDRLWIHATEYQQAATVSLVNPSSTKITEVNGIAWNANQGYTGDGIASCLNTNWKPNGDAVQYTQNSACIGNYCLTSAASGSASVYTMGVWGTTSSPRISINQFNVTPNNLAWSIQAIGSDRTGKMTAANQTAAGLWSFIRTSGSAGTFFRQGVNVLNTGLAGTSQALTAFGTNTLYLLATNNNGNIQGFDTKQIAISFVGSGSINQATFFTAIQAFATARRFNV